ncbi:MAG: hypothetical protein C4547_16530, partial [Phycisphaerales bacterium]
ARGSLAGGGVRAMHTTGVVLMACVSSLVAPLRSWSRWATVRWKLRYLWHYLRITLIGATSVYVAIAGAMLGFVTIFFGFSQLPYPQVTVPLLREEFLAAAGYSTFRVIAPLLICVLLAGKVGAALAADIGARRLTKQFDAMRSFGASPAAYMHGNMVIAMVLSMPVLTALAYLANVYASLVAFLLTSPEATLATFRRNYFATVLPGGAAPSATGGWSITSGWPVGAGWVLLKVVCCGVLIAAVAYALGNRRKESSVAVSRDTGLTIFWASLGVLAIHTAFSFVEFE